MDGGRGGGKRGVRRLKMTEIKLPECQQRSLVLQTGKGRGDFWLQGRGRGGGGGKRSKLKEQRSKRERGYGKNSCSSTNAKTWSQY